MLVAKKSMIRQVMIFISKNFVDSSEDDEILGFLTNTYIFQLNELFLDMQEQGMVAFL
jgi:hypothetical protein